MWECARNGKDAPNSRLQPAREPERKRQGGSLHPGLAVSLVEDNLYVRARLLLNPESDRVEGECRMSWHCCWEQGGYMEARRGAWSCNQS